MKDLSLHLMDIIQNSISAKADKITVSIIANRERDELVIEIGDNGVGMDEEFLKEVINPFVTTRTTRKVGLGIPLFRASAQMAGGDLVINSKKNQGTVLKAKFQISHIDRLPLGDVAETVSSVIMASPEIEFELVLDNKNESFRFNSIEIKKVLGDVSIIQLEVIMWIRDYIREGIEIIFGGVLNEIYS